MPQCSTTCYEVWSKSFTAIVVGESTFDFECHRDTLSSFKCAEKWNWLSLCVLFRFEMRSPVKATSIRQRCLKPDLLCIYVRRYVTGTNQHMCLRVCKVVCFSVKSRNFFSSQMFEEEEKTFWNHIVAGGISTAWKPISFHVLTKL